MDRRTQTGNRKRRVRLAVAGLGFGVAVHNGSFMLIRIRVRSQKGQPVERRPTQPEAKLIINDLDIVRSA